MRAFLLAVIAIATGIAAAACGSSESTTTTQSQTFASQQYGFRVTLTQDWTQREPSMDWDGKELGGRDDPMWANLTEETTDRQLVVAAAPTGMTLAAFRAAMQSALVPLSCSAPSSPAPTTLDGEPALAWTETCTDGCDLNNLAALHGTDGYIIVMCSLEPSNAAENRRIFESMRRSFRFTR
jgi:hypothetical protein